MKSSFILLAFLLVLGLVASLSLCIGPTDLVTLHKLVSSLTYWITNGSFNEAPKEVKDCVLVVSQIRLPRVLMAILVGAALAVSGVLLQALFRNNLSEPYLLGISSGAGLGAVGVLFLNTIVWAVPVSDVDSFRSLGAFVGSLSVVSTVWILAREGNQLPIVRLLLTGVAVAALCSALTTFLLLRINAYDLRALLMWLMGSVAYQTMADVLWLLPWAFVGLALSWFFNRELDLISLDELTASQLGLPVERIKVFILLLASLLTAATVAVVGVVAFVGLMVPHISRLLIGPTHRLLIPVSAIIGAGLLVIADVGSRTFLPGEELPLSMITSILGCFFFLYLLRKQGLRNS